MRDTTHSSLKDSLLSASAPNNRVDRGIVQVVRVSRALRRTAVVAMFLIATHAPCAETSSDNSGACRNCEQALCAFCRSAMRPEAVCPGTEF